MPNTHLQQQQRAKQMQRAATIHMLAQSYASAAAHVEAIDALRPNAVYGLHPSPNSLGTIIKAGQSAQCQKVTIEAGSTIVGVYGSRYDDAAGFVLSSLKFGANEAVKQAPMGLSAIYDTVARSDRLVALIGHRLPATLDIQATVVLLNTQDQYFRGINILVIDGTCRPVSTNAAPAPGFAGFSRVVPTLRNALNLFGPRKILR
jgi:hypothetical protein